MYDPDDSMLVDAFYKAVDSYRATIQGQLEHAKEDSPRKRQRTASRKNEDDTTFGMKKSRQPPPSPVGVGSRGSDDVEQPEYRPPPLVVGNVVQHPAEATMQQGHAGTMHIHPPPAPSEMQVQCVSLSLSFLSHSSFLQGFVAFLVLGRIQCGTMGNQ